MLESCAVPFLIFLFVLAVAVWMIPVVRYGRMSILALAVLGVGTVLGPEFFAVDGPIQISFDRILWAGMFALAAWQWKIGQLPIPRVHRIDWLVVGIVGWFLVSALLSGGGTASVARWIFYILMPAGMYAIARVTRFESNDITWIVRGAIGLMVYLAITAVLEVAGAHWLVFPKFITDPTRWEFLGRGRGPLMNPAGNGILLSVGLMATVAGFLKAEGHRAKALFVALGLLMLVGVGATLTRSVWMGAGAILAVVCVMRAPRWVRVWGVALVVLMGGLSAAGLKDQLLGFKRDKTLTAADAKKSVELRPLLAIVAWEMFKDRPLIGHGYGGYVEHNPPYHVNRSYDLPLEEARNYVQHNVFLSILVDAGLIGLLMFAAWLVTLAAIGWKLAQNRAGPAGDDQQDLSTVGFLLLGMLITYGCNGMFHDVMVIPMVHMFLFYLGGVTMTVHQRGLETSAQTVREPYRASDRAAVPA